jgi:hypothetical protein
MLTTRLFDIFRKGSDIVTVEIQLLGTHYKVTTLVVVKVCDLIVARQWNNYYYKLHVVIIILVYLRSPPDDFERADRSAICILAFET